MRIDRVTGKSGTAVARCVLGVWLGVSGLVSSSAQGPALRRGVADILETAGSLADPGVRRAAVDEIRARQVKRRLAGEERARDLNLPFRVERPDGTVKEIADVDENGNPVYLLTHNSMAAVSTGAARLHAQPYALSGQGLVIGMWDGGSGRATHREFATGRMVVKDGAASIDHATHVGGTLIAAGVTASAKGMAFAATVDSYDWNSDKAEMTERGASAPEQAGKIYLSNHSYGYLAGWYKTGGSSPAYIWYGSGTTAASIDPRFGQYNTYARDSDALAYNAPYYLMFRSAGNDRTDNPSAGQMVQLSPSSTATVAYDPAVHPAGDGSYRGGFDTINFDSVAKNVITIGSVTDAVTSGARDVSKANISDFSSWGPTDDGRIKPDVVANGHSLYSTLSGGDDSYGYISGTSMSSPNAAGTAALLIEEYRRLFPGSAMRSSMLKGLLIHTADDLGNPGPDYKYGWGLINATNAVDLIRDHAASPEKSRMLEGLVTTAVPSLTSEFIWDGVSPIRATLCWTDPAGASTTSADLRSPRLRNNLDLRIIGPDNQSFSPYVLPFVGVWTTDSMNAPAVTGTNNTDNTEQVYIASPPAPGVYRAVVSYQGTLTDSKQAFSLLLNGSSGEEPPPPPLSLQSVSPASAFSGATVTLETGGIALDTATDLRLVREGFTAFSASNLRMSGDRLLGEVNLAGAASGYWNVRVANAAETSLLEGAFLVIGALWSESFDGAVSGWSSSVVNNEGNNQWVLSTAQADTPPRSCFAPGPATKSMTALVSPPIAVPPGATDLQLRFRHLFNLQSRRDGGRLEFSINDGDWTGVDDSGSGTVFASNGYITTILGASSFANKSAWTGQSGGFIETVVSLTDTARFAGKTVRFRWVLATDGSTSSAGWYVDSMVLLGGSDLSNQPPLITQPIAVASAEAVTENEQPVHLVSDSSVSLTVLASDDGGADNLTYIWSASGPEPVFFLPDSSPNAYSTEAFFEALGDYTVSVTVTDDGGLSTIDTVLIRILAAPTALRIEPGVVSLRVGESISFSASLLDQFNDLMEEQPDSFSWAATGGGTVDANGLFFAETAGENYSVFASASGLNGFVSLLSEGTSIAQGGVSDSAQVTVLQGTAAVTLSGLDVFYDGSPKAVTVETSPAGLAVRVTYDGSEQPPVQPGSYAVEAVVTDPNYEGLAEGTLVISYDFAAYEDWIASFGVFGEEAYPDADPDGDGMNNWLEWRFGFDPKDQDSRLCIRLLRQDAKLNLIINRVSNEGVFSIEYTGVLTTGWQPFSKIRPEQTEDDFKVELPDDSAQLLFVRVVFFLGNP